MATIPLVYIQQKDIIGDNLLPIEYSFEKSSTFTITAGTGTSVISDNYFNVFSGKYGLVSTNLDYQNNDYSFWLTDIPFISTFDGYAIFSFYLNDISDNVKVNIEMFINGISVNLYTIDTSNDSVSTDNLWRRYAQRFLLSVGNSVTFKITIKKDTTSSSPEREIIFDAFKLEIDDKGVGFPTTYMQVPTNNFEWHSRVDTTNTQSLTASTNNAFGFAGTSEKSNDFEIVDNTGLVIPIKQSDVVTIDYAFTLVTPSGTDRYIDVLLICDGVTYRGCTYPLVHGSGNNQHISGSFTLPVGATFLSQGARIYLNPNANCNINTRYISVVEHSNPII